LLQTFAVDNATESAPVIASSTKNVFAAAHATGNAADTPAIHSQEVEALVANTCSEDCHTVRMLQRYAQ